MIDVKFKLDIDKHNINLFHNGYNNPDKKFICKQCGTKVTLGSSYSNKGKDLLCIGCINKNARELDMSVAEYAKRYIYGR